MNLFEQVLAQIEPSRRQPDPLHGAPSINPNAALYRKRTEPLFSPDVSEALGFVASEWVPLTDDELARRRHRSRRLSMTAAGAAAAAAAAVPEPRGPREALSLGRDLQGFHPLRLGLTVGHPGGGESEMSEDWFETLLSTLRDQIRAFAKTHFRVPIDVGLGAGTAGSTHTSTDRSPWADISSPPGLRVAASSTIAVVTGQGTSQERRAGAAFVRYAAEAACKDPIDGGWDQLLVSPAQRSYLVAGVLARALDEHVLSDLLFGGDQAQHEAMEMWDRIMIDSEGFFRKSKRSEETRFFLMDNMLTSRFWESVDQVTAELTAMLLPVVNMQRRRAVGDRPAQAVLVGLRPLYQQLHEIVTVAGYTSLCMARSRNIFEFGFSLLEDFWRSLGEEMIGAKHVYNRSLQLNYDKEAAELAVQQAAQAGGPTAQNPAQNPAQYPAAQPPLPPPVPDVVLETPKWPKGNNLLVPRVKIAVWPAVTYHKLEAVNKLMPGRQEKRRPRYNPRIDNTKRDIELAIAASIAGTTNAPNSARKANDSDDDDDDDSEVTAVAVLLTPSQCVYMAGKTEVDSPPADEATSATVPDLPTHVRRVCRRSQHAAVLPALAVLAAPQGSAVLKVAIFAVYAVVVIAITELTNGPFVTGSVTNLVTFAALGAAVAGVTAAAAVTAAAPAAARMDARSVDGVPAGGGL